MKRFTQLMCCCLAMGLALLGCRQESVRPLSSVDGRELLAAAADSIHPSLDTICKITQPIRFRSSDGSYNVNKRLIAGSGGCFATITDPTQLAAQPEWGSFVMYNGYIIGLNAPVHWLDVDFTLAPGWMCDFTNWVFTVNDDITIDPNTGLPVIGTDWSYLQYNPLRNEWKVSVLVSELPSPCFDLACRMSVVRLFLGSVPGGANCIPTTPLAPNENTRTTIWGINEAWNDPNSDLQSNNEFAVRYCPFGCLEQQPTPEDTICVNVNVGVPALSNCVNLDGTYSGSGVSYAWSTGATTPTINACPTASTTYSVTISEGGDEVLIKRFNVNVTNIACGNGNGNNGIHKVWVCHKPPGNPANVQNICIDWSGVPAHVARFRLPGMNIRQGHDSGCEIGQCGSNPCN